MKPLQLRYSLIGNLRIETVEEPENPGVVLVDDRLPIIFSQDILPSDMIRWLYDSPQFREAESSVLIRRAKDAMMTGHQGVMERLMLEGIKAHRRRSHDL